MMGDFLSRVLLLGFGYAYPAYECYKTVELNKPEIEKLIFWILVALLTVLERFGDFAISWLPLYSEAKLMFFIYLWCPRTKGTTYVYETFFRPYISQYENDIDCSILEFRARAGDMLVVYWQKVAIVGQTTFFNILKYASSQSPAHSSRTRPSQSEETKIAPSNPKTRRLLPTKSAPTVSTRSIVAAAKPVNDLKSSGPKFAADEAPSPASNSDMPSSKPSTPPLPRAEEDDDMSIDEVDIPIEDVDEPVATPEVSPMEEAIRVTRGRLRQRVAAVSTADGRAAN
uniref:HVA22-like protein n=1 Tax=Leersia perrieri TaxID=77586 RepID=A0A0D9XI69_9ORYZ